MSTTNGVIFYREMDVLYVGRLFLVCRRIHFRKCYMGLNIKMHGLGKLSNPLHDGAPLIKTSLSGVLIVFALSPDVFDLSISDGCLQENEETTENGINPELAKVDCLHYYTLIRVHVKSCFLDQVCKCLFLMLHCKSEGLCAPAPVVKHQENFKLKE